MSGCVCSCVTVYGALWGCVHDKNTHYTHVIRKDEACAQCRWEEVALPAPQTTNPSCSVLRVEGCVPACPTPKVLDEVTQRCVYLEDCEWPARTPPPELL